MKSISIILLFIFLFFSLSADEISIKEKMELAKQDWKNLSFELYVSPGVIADVGIGLTNNLKLENCYQEITLILHADLFPHVWEQNIDEFYKIYFWGAKFRSAYFYKEDYSGFNWFVNIGFQSIHVDFFKSSWYTLPDVAVGCGYSWKLKNDHHFRISMDAGIKVYISNLYFSYVW